MNRQYLVEQRKILRKIESCNQNIRRYEKNRTNENYARYLGMKIKISALRRLLTSRRYPNHKRIKGVENDLQCSSTSRRR